VSRRVRICALEDLAKDQGTRVEVGSRAIALVRFGDSDGCGDTVYAIGDTCSHADVSLSMGEVDPDECTIECWKHGSLFSLTTGEALTLPATRPVPTYEVVVEDGDVLLVLDDGTGEDRA
jgi:3-phenylpropionate/trans-cinnamate dioxygenase ferredoxin subunit